MIGRKRLKVENRPIIYIFFFQNVEVTYSIPTGSTPNLTFQRQEPYVGAPLGPDGTVLKTSVCDDIEESVKRAAKIEEELANSKVSYKIYYIKNLTETLPMNKENKLKIN